MQKLKYIIAVLISVALIANPAIACCASASDQSPIESAHDCGHMAKMDLVGEDEKPPQNQSDHQMDCEGCAECGLVAQADHLVKPVATQFADLEKSPVTVSWMPTQEARFRVLQKYILPPAQAPPVPATLVQLKIRLIV